MFKVKAAGESAEFTTTGSQGNHKRQEPFGCPPGIVKNKKLVMSRIA